jgi:hypothetical protein
MHAFRPLLALKQTPEVTIAELIKDFRFEPSQEEHDWEVIHES